MAMPTEDQIEHRVHTLDCGIELEVLALPGRPQQCHTDGTQAEDAERGVEPPDADNDGPPPAAAAAAGAATRIWPAPVVLLHGAWHGAWAWTPHFMPHLAARGHDCYALSMRGHGASQAGGAARGSHPGTLASHAADLASFVATLPRPPVLVAHSKGGLVALKYAAGAAEGRLPPKAGLGLLAAQPPSGEAGLLKRLLWQSPWSLVQVGFSMARRRSSASTFRFLFFSPNIPPHELQRYAALLAAAPQHTLTRRRGAQPPDDAVPQTGPAEGSLPPERVCVGCGTADVLVDAEAARETAACVGFEAALFDGAPHDLKLSRWREPADALARWLATLAPLP